MNICFNFIKIVAAISVFLLHFAIFAFRTGKCDIQSLPTWLFTPAWTGVWIFFILSGFLIGKGFWTGKYKTDNLKDFSKFYTNRALKILPLYFFIVILDVLFINTNMYFNGSETLSRVLTFRLRNPFVNPMIGNLWFISTIVQLYLLTPFVWKFILNPISKLKNSKIFLVILMSLLTFGFYGLRIYWWNNNVSWDYFILCNIIANLDLFFVPFIFSKFTEEQTDTKLKKILRYTLIPIIITFFITNTYFMQKVITQGNFQELVKIDFTTYTLILLLVIFFAYDVSSQYIKEGMSKIKTIIIKTINYGGAIAFSFYACHCQIMHKTLSIFKNDWISALCFTIIFNLVWAILLHYFIEKPFIKRKIQ